MTTGNWIALLGIAATVVVALLVSRLQRKQMQQIELFRLNPSVGVVPPRHPITLFLAKYWVAIIDLGMPYSI
jgi:hypothetical protein